MNKLDEIRQRTEAAKAQKEKGDSITAACIAWSIVANDIPYLLSEVDLLNKMIAGYQNAVMPEFRSQITALTAHSREDMEWLLTLADALKAQLAESQRREQAAVEHMKIIADTYRERNCDDGICGLCKFDADHGLDGYANECPGFEAYDCFEWRGPQDVKGEAK